MKDKACWLVAGLFGVSSFMFTGAAGARCLVGKTGCDIDVPRSVAIVPKVAAKVSALRDEFWGVAGIVPIDGRPEGQTYGHWATQWHQWAQAVPKDVNPVLDTTGEHCAQRQVDDVWFLAGTFGVDPVVRNCKIPRGKSLFFPLINNGYGAFLNDPPEQRTEEFLRAAGSCTEPAKIEAWIDHIRVPNPVRFFTGPSGSQSPLFNLQLPPGNRFDLDETVIPELVLSPAAEQGYYLFVRPLRPGTHTIKWTATGCVPGGRQEITYNLTVGD